MAENRLEGKVTLGEGENAKEVEFYVVKPSNQVLKGADLYKSKTWNQAIQDGVLTRKELETVMKKRGIWNKEKEDEEKSIAAEISRLEKLLYHGDGSKQKLSRGRELAVEMRKNRNKLRELLNERYSMEQNTAESLSDNARFDYIVAHCTFYNNGQPVYKNLEDYNSKSADSLAFSAASLLSKMLYNLDASFEKNLPENKFLSKFGLVNDDLSLVDPNNPEHLIDTEGRRIDEDGYYLDSDGNRIDKDGNKLTEDGDYEVTAEYENDLVISSPQPKEQEQPQEPQPEDQTSES